MVVRRMGNDGLNWTILHHHKGIACSADCREESQWPRHRLCCMWLEHFLVENLYGIPEMNLIAAAQCSFDDCRNFVLLLSLDWKSKRKIPTKSLIWICNRVFLNIISYMTSYISYGHILTWLTNLSCPKTASKKTLFQNKEIIKLENPSHNKNKCKNSTWSHQIAQKGFKIALNQSNRSFLKISQSEADLEAWIWKPA